MSSGKVLIAIFALCGIVALVMFANPSVNRNLLAKNNEVESDSWRAFQEFTQKYNRTYSNLQEMQERFGIFNMNYFWIKVENQKNLESYWEVNQFTDLSQEEFERIYLTYREDEQLLGEFEEESNIEPPNEVDWTQKGAVTSIRDQGRCGSCWAHSAVAALEGAYFQKTGELKEFSEQQLVDCDKVSGGCDGGLMYTAFDYWKKTAAALRSKYSYTGKEGTCKSVAGVTKTTGYTRVTANEASLAKASAERVVSVAVDASYWSSYGGGIYSGSCSSTRLNHAVTLVGYGTESGQDFWKIKNSWGNWGDKGYIKLKKTNKIIGSGHCGVAKNAIYPKL